MTKENGTEWQTKLCAREYVCTLQEYCPTGQILHIYGPVLLLTHEWIDIDHATLTFHTLGFIDHVK